MQLLISENEIRQRIVSIARLLNDRYLDQELVLVMVMKGSLFLAADLMRELTVPCILEFVVAKSYGQRGTQRGELSLYGLEEVSVTGKNVLVIDDIFDSGETLNQIYLALQKKEPKNLTSLVLLSKAVHREIEFYPEYVLFEISNEFVVGYGLDYKEYYRNLSEVYSCQFKD